MKALFSSSWALLRANLKHFLIATIVLGIVSLITAVFATQGMVFWAVAQFVTIYISLMWIIYLLEAVGGEKKAIWSYVKKVPSKTYLRFLGFTILFTLLLSLLFVIPWLLSIQISSWFLVLTIFGLYATVVFMFSPYFIVDGSGVIESFKKSFHATRGYEWKLLWLLVLLALVNVLGLLALGIGLIVTTLLTKIILAETYLKVIKKS